MRRAGQILGLIFVIALLVAPASATAAHYAPPGKAGANQYFETIPTSGGNVAPPSYNASPPSGTTTTPTLATTGAGSHGTKKLGNMGKTGAAAANFAQSTAPPVPESNTSTGVGKLAANPGGSALGSLSNVLTGSDAGGIGILMPLMLGLSLLIAVAFGAYRAIRR